MSCVPYRGHCLEQDLHDAIERSKLFSEVVHLPYSDGAAGALYRECEAHAIENDGTYDYVGVDLDNVEWRVRLDPVEEK